MSQIKLLTVNVRDERNPIQFPYVAGTINQVIDKIMKEGLKVIEPATGDLLYYPPSEIKKLRFLKADLPQTVKVSHEGITKLIDETLIKR